MAGIAGKRIAISGAGVAGSAFALALEQACQAKGVNPLPVISIYERDARSDARSGLGYSFGINEGLSVIRNLQRGILSELMQLQEPGNAAHICYQTFSPILVAKPGQPTLSDEGDTSSQSLRIMRSTLQQTLLSRLPNQCLNFGKTCVSATPPKQEGDSIQLKFADGESAECDILVVADGRNSKLRRVLQPQESLEHAGICMLFGRTKPLDRLPPEAERGVNIVLGRYTTSLFLGPVDRSTVVWSITSKAPPSRADELNDMLKDADAAERYKSEEIPKLARQQGFSEPFYSVVKHTPASELVAMSGSDKLSHRLNNDQIVYLGDAWHPMTPFSGGGANSALLEAWELAHELADAKNVQAAIDSFAEKAAPRANKFIETSHNIVPLVTCDGWKKQLLLIGLRIAGLLQKLYKSVQPSS